MTRARTHGAALATAALLAACGAGRGCGGQPGGADGAARGDEPRGGATVDAARCRREVAQAAVATPPGGGAIDTLVPTCGPGDSLTVWSLRGHTLARLTRPRAPGAPFAPPEIVATGADRLGPVGPDDALGPVVWRSPTVAAIEPELESDEWWAAWIDPAAPAGARVRRGSAVMPPHVAGLGVLAAVARTGEGVAVLGTIARAGRNPQLVTHTVRAPRDEVDALASDPPSLGEGELKAYEPAARAALLYSVIAGGAVRVRAVQHEGAARWVERGALELARHHVLVAARGVALGDGRAREALFALSDFDVARREQGPCLEVDPSLCVRPGAVTLVRVGPGGVRRYEVAPEGLVDALALDGAGRAVVMFVGAGAARARAARVDLASGRVTALRLVGADLPPLDHPSLVRCGREVWMAAEVLVSEGDGSAEGGATPRESAVMALPFDCVAAAE